MPFFMIPLTTLTLSAVRPSETASAAGMQNFLRTMAIAISTSVVLTAWGDGQRVSRNEMASVLQAGDTQAQLSASGMSAEQIRQFISSIVDREATVIAMDYVFFISMILLFVAAAMVWLAPKPTGKVDTSAAH